MSIAPSPAAAEPPVSAAGFRSALARFASGVTVMTTADAEGVRHGVTATSFASLSLDPPLIQWSLRRAARACPVFSAATHFAVNILAAGQEDLSRRFASPVVDRFAGVAVEPGTGGAILLPGALAWLECTTETLLPGGDHVIIVGRVIQARVFPGYPLLHWHGRYFHLPEESERPAD